MRLKWTTWLVVPGALAAALCVSAEPAERNRVKPDGPPPEVQRIQEQLRQLHEEQLHLTKTLKELQGRIAESRAGAPDVKGVKKQPLPEKPPAPPAVKKGGETPPGAWAPGRGPGMGMGGWQNRPQGPDGQGPGMGPGQGQRMGPGPGPWMGRPNPKGSPAAPPAGGRCWMCPNRQNCPHQGSGGQCPRGIGPGGWNPSRGPGGGPAWQRGAPDAGWRGRVQPFLQNHPGVRDRMKEFAQRHPEARDLARDFMQGRPGARDRVREFMERNPQVRERAKQFLQQHPEARERLDRFRGEMRGRMEPRGPGRPGFSPEERPGGPPPDVDGMLREMRGMLDVLRERMSSPPPGRRPPFDHERGVDPGREEKRFQMEREREERMRVMREEQEERARAKRAEMERRDRELKKQPDREAKEKAAKKGDKRGDEEKETKSRKEKDPDRERGPVGERGEAAGCESCGGCSR